MTTPRSIIIDDLMRAADRKDMLCANVPVCEQCHSNQVQLTHTHAPARWRCRMCKHVFAREPSPISPPTYTLT